MQGFELSDRLITMGALFLIILLHEFGHCFAARSVGGSAEEIIMTPLGGLAMAHAPRNPWGTFVTVAGGPLVNVAIYAISPAFSISWVGSDAPYNPLRLLPPFGLGEFAIWVWWFYATSYAILMFNLLPIFPLDGGQLMQSILWPRMGYYRSMLFSCNVGFVGSIVLGIMGLVSNNLLLVFIAISCVTAASR